MGVGPQVVQVRGGPQVVQVEAAATAGALRTSWPKYQGGMGDFSAESPMGDVMAVSYCHWFARGVDGCLTPGGTGPRLPLPPVHFEGVLAQVPAVHG